ncbi:MAG: hypothetical protein IPG86_10240 [Chitinophagaceae bacterium]|nr:hypothetical protein [Chitinophagaceae bacterium]
MKIFIKLLVLLTLHISCKNKKTILIKPDTTPTITDNSPTISLTKFANDTLINLYNASVVLPKNWRLANDDTLLKIGDATARYRFHNKKDKLIYLEYGLGTRGNPAEPNILSSRFRKGYIALNADTSDILFTDNPRVAVLRKQSSYQFSTENISNYKAVYFRPKSTGNGYIGIYIDSIGEIAGNIPDWVMFAEALDKEESREFEKVFRSLIIKGLH